MKICLAGIAPFIGGAEVAMVRLASGLKHLNQEVICVVGKHTELIEKIQSENIRCLHLPMPHTSKIKCFQYWHARKQFRHLLKSEKIDILHCNDLPSFQLPGDAAKPLGIPKICHHRWIYKGEGISWFLKSKADFHMFVSNALREQLINAYPPMKLEKGCVNYDGLEIPSIPGDEDKMAIRKQVGLPSDKIIVLFAGQIIFRKGVQDLIKAWKILHEDIKKKTYLCVIGDDLADSGEYLKKMKILTQDVGIQADFRGYQKNVDNWLNAVDIVTVPSHIEPLGNATLEAMAHKKPVIGCSVGGIPEMIVDKETGFLVPPENPKLLSKAIETLVSDNNLRLAMGIASRKRIVEHFSLKAHAERTLIQYNNLINNNVTSVTKG